MTRTAILIAAAAALLASCSSEPAKPVIKVDDVWARAVAPGQTTGAVYMAIQNDGDADDALMSAKVSVAPNSEIHQTMTEGNMAKMNHAGPIAVPSKSTVTLKPGGTHVMMTGLTVPLSPGDRFFVDMQFETSGHVTAAGKVVAAGAR
nr:copper chaperone PCu(A)C [uncultured Sphingomonas sp.]